MLMHSGHFFLLIFMRHCCTILTGSHSSECFTHSTTTSAHSVSNSCLPFNLWFASFFGFFNPLNTELNVIDILTETLYNHKLYLFNSIQELCLTLEACNSPWPHPHDRKTPFCCFYIISLDLSSLGENQERAAILNRYWYKADMSGSRWLCTCCNLRLLHAIWPPYGLSLTSNNQFLAM